MIDIQGLKVIKRTKPIDLIVWSTSFFACLLWSLEFGILLAIGVSVVLDTITTSSQQLNRVKKTEVVDGWKVDKSCKTAGKPSVWGPKFVETRDNNGFVAIKINGSLTFSMARKLEERFAIIVEYLRSQDRMSAIAIDMTVCPDLDFTGTMAVKKVLSLSAPRVVPASSKDAADLYNSGTVVYMVGLSDRVRKTLRRAGVFDTTVDHGGWPLMEAVDLDTALMAFPVDARAAKTAFPGKWQAPAARPADEEPNTLSKGQDGESWIVWAGKPGDRSSHTWIRTGTTQSDSSGVAESLPDEDVSRTTSRDDDGNGSDGSNAEESTVVLPSSSAVTWHGGEGFAAEAARQLNAKFRRRHSGGAHGPGGGKSSSSVSAPAGGQLPDNAVVLGGAPARNQEGGAATTPTEDEGRKSAV